MESALYATFNSAGKHRAILSASENIPYNLKCPIFGIQNNKDLVLLFLFASATCRSYKEYEQRLSDSYRDNYTE